MSDLIHHPPHYSNSRFGIECIEFARFMTFPAGNGFKYVWRHEDKNSLEEDLQKALVYNAWAKEDFEKHGIHAILPGKEGLLFTMACKHLSGPTAHQGAYKALRATLYNAHDEVAWYITDYLEELADLSA